MAFSRGDAALVAMTVLSQFSQTKTFQQLANVPFLICYGLDRRARTLDTVHKQIAS